MFRAKSILILLLFCQWLGLQGQNDALINEIKDKISKANDAQLFPLINNLAWEYRFAYPDSTIYYANQAYELGKAQFLKKGLAQSLNYIGVAYDKKGEPINAYEKFTAAFALAEKQKDSTQIAYSNNNLGRLLSDQGIHVKALDYFIKARKMFEFLKDSSGQAYVYQSIGRIFLAQNDFVKANQNFAKAYELRIALGNTRDIMAALLYLGDVSSESGAIDEALYYFKKADSVGRVINDRINLAEIHIFMAKNYLAKNMLDSAQLLSDQGLKVITSQNALRTLPEALLVRGEVMTALSRLAEAESFYRQALTIAEKTKELDVKLKAHYLLWKLAEAAGKKAEGIHHYNQYLIIQDSLKDLEVTRHLERLQFEIEIQNRDMQTQLIRAKDEAIIQRAQLQNIILSIATFFTVVVISILWRNNKKKQEVNKKLLDQNHKLEELNHVKDTLMSIVAHDLKSPINRISGLVNLIEMDKSADSTHQYIGIIKKTAQSGLSLIGDLLDLNATEEIKLKPVAKTFDLSKTIKESIEHYHEAINVKNISIEIKTERGCIVHSDISFVGRIVDNLLSNAIKFSPIKTKISLNFGSNEKEFFITVKDEGPGFSDKDKTQLYQKFKKLSAQPTAGESSNGLGLAIVKNLTDSLGGRIELKSEVGKGSEFTVTITHALVLAAEVI